MRFTIGQISKLTGFSVSGIRYYEQAGVISPVRGKNGKYRDFSMHELQLLLECKQYRDCGFSLPESVELLNKAGVRQVSDQLSELAVKLKQVITQKQLLLELIERKSGEIDCLLNEVPCIELVRLPAIYRFKVWQPGADEKLCLPYKKVFDWLDLAPFTTSSLLLSVEGFTKGQGDIETDWGLAIEEHVVDALGKTPAPYGVYFPSREYIRTLVPVTDDLCINSTHLKPSREFLRENGLIVCSPVITRLFYLTNTNNRFQRYDELWIPIRHSI